MSVHVSPSIVVPSSLDGFSCLTPLTVGGVEYHYYSLEKAGAQLGIDARRLPQSHKILLERMLAREDGEIITKEQIQALADWIKNSGKSDAEIYLYANRVLLQDLTGVTVTLLKVAPLHFIREKRSRLILNSCAIFFSRASAEPEACTITE